MPQPDAATLADEIEAAIDAWHDCAPGGQGEGWTDGATGKFNAMAQAFYDNSETILAALRTPPVNAGQTITEDVVSNPARVWDNEQKIFRPPTDDEIAARAALASLPPVVDAELQARQAALVDKAQALIAKLDECQPHIDNAFTIQWARSGVHYSGPTYGVELDALRAVLNGEAPNG